MQRPSLESVLLVEDEPDIQRIARLALESVGGLTVDICDSGTKAIKMASQLQPDLILLDVMLPGMDGLTTFDSLKSNPDTSTIPVIFMTAKVQPHEVREYENRGALGVIVKPFDPMTLAQTVRTKWEKGDG